MKDKHPKKPGIVAEKPSKQSPVPKPSRGNTEQWLAGALLGGGSVFFLSSCLDRYLAPRFFWVSVVLLFALFASWKVLMDRKQWSLHLFDLLLVGWYGFNALSVCWAFSWSEAVFTAQKSLLLLGAYGFFRFWFIQDETRARLIFRDILNVLTLLCGVLLTGQLCYAAIKVGLSNDALYDYASGIFGNKSLAADFLFLLLSFQVLLHGVQPRRWISPLFATVLLLLILLLQVRTVYAAVLFSSMAYVALWAWQNPISKPVLYRKVLPLLAAVFFGLIVLVQKQEGSLAERLNPLNYLESTSFNERRFVWYKTDLLNAEHPWLGVGAGAWKLWFPSKGIEGGYRLQQENIVFTRAHNDYLEIRAEMGILGAGYYLLLFGAIFGTAFWCIWKRSGTVRQQHELSTLVAALLGYCVIQYFDFPRERVEMQVMLGLLFAWTAHQSSAAWERMPVLRLGRLRPIVFLIFASLLAFNVVIGWYRIQGEVATIKIFEATAENKPEAVQGWAAEAENPFYEYSDVVLPLCWYQGLALLRKNQPAAAIPHLERAFRLNPWSFQVVNNYATALAMSGQNQAAVPLMLKVLEINPAYEDGKMNLAITYQSLGQIDKAREMVQQVDTIPNPGTPVAIEKNRDIKVRKATLMEQIGLEQKLAK
jgi:O-antigen ligase